MSSSHLPPQSPLSPVLEKAGTDDSISEIPQRRPPKVLPSNPHVWRPLLIFLGPLPVLVFIWVFFSVIFSRPIALPDYLAVHAEAHGQNTTMIVSIVGTIVATYVSFLFSWAVRYAIAVRLVAAERTSLYFLTPATCIAHNTLWRLHPGSLWAWIVVLTFTGVSLQTSGLTSFFEIGQIAVSADITGWDLDLANSELLQLSSSVQLPVTYDAISSFFLQNVMIDAMLVKNSTHSTFDFNGYNYLSTTGGIHPATYVTTHDYDFTFNASAEIPANLEDITSRKHFSLPFNKTMQLVQQGFTADVDCRIKDPRDNATYHPVLTGEQISTSGLSLVALEATCPNSTVGTQAGPVVYNSADTQNSGLIIGVACPIPNTFNYDVIIRATGAYNVLDLTTCTVIPKTTLVDVTYFIPPPDQDVPTSVNVSMPREGSETSVPVWGGWAVEMLLYNILLAQSVQGNTMGNAWFFAPGAGANATIAQAMNTYIKAGIEFTGTVIRQVWSQPGNPLAPAGLSNSNYTTPIHGTFLASTQGWHQDSKVSPLFLLPTTLTILATYGVLIYGIKLARDARKSDDSGRRLQHEDAHFDPTDIVHIIAAQAPESRQEDFRSFSHRSTSWMKKTSVGMQLKDGVRTLAILPTKTGTDRPASMGLDVEKIGSAEKGH